MKRNLWKTLMACGLAVSLTSTQLYAQGGKSGGGGEGGGDGRGAQAGGGGVRAGGGASAGASRQGGGGHPQGGGIGRGGSPPVSGGSRPTSVNRSPTFSQPNLGTQPRVPSVPQAARPQQVARPTQVARPQQVARPPQATVRPGTGVQLGTGATRVQPDRGRVDNVRPGAPVRINDGLPGVVGQPRVNNGRGPRDNMGAGVGVGTQLTGANRNRILGQSLGGNSINFNNRTLNLGRNNYQPAFNRHSQYRGYWNGNYGGGYGGGYGRGYGSGLGLNLGNGLGLSFGNGYGGYGWGGGYGGYGRYGGYRYRPLGWGLGAWGLGSLAYNSGYLGYSNPYYNNSYGSYGNYNYSQPIPVAYYDAPALTNASNPTTCEQSLDDAIAAFKQNDYDVALDLVNKGLVQCPDDSVMHEFRALALFAKADYQQAASTIHAVLAVGPGWNWTTLSSMYPGVSVYTPQLRALEAFTKQYPQDAAARFLLAYHYMADGYPDAAVRHLEQVVKLVPNDRVAADVLRMISKPPADQPTETGQLPMPQPPTDSQSAATSAAKPVDPAMLVGVWQATREEGSKFELTLKNDATFHWKFTQKDTVQEFGGTYTVEGNVLALERKDGGSLIAGVVPGGEKQFNFKLLGAPEEDPGLNFGK